MSSRPRRPLPPTNGWMAWNCSCSMAHCTRSGSAPRSCRKVSQASRRLQHLGHRRRHVGRGGQRRAGRAEPVLRGAELAGRALRRRSRRAGGARAGRARRSSDSGSSRRRSTPKRSVAMQLRTSRRWSRGTLAGAAPTWSSRRSERLTSAPSMRDEQSASWRLNGSVEQLRVGQLAADAGELAERGVGARQRQHQLVAVPQPGRQRRRHEGGIAFGAGDDLVRLRGHESRWGRWSLPFSLVDCPPTADPQGSSS